MKGVRKIKKVLSLLLVLGLCLRLTGCASNDKKDDKKPQQEATVTKDEIEIIDLSITEDLGEYVLHAKFKNNSKEIVNNIIYYYTVGDEEINISTDWKTLKAGETSIECKSTTFNTKVETTDLELTLIMVTFDKNIKDDYNSFRYDYKSKKYEYSHTV